MEETKRPIIDFAANVHRALRMRAATCSRSISDMVNVVVRLTLAEDTDDCRDVEQRQHGPSIAFEDFVAELRKSGRL